MPNPEVIKLLGVLGQMFGKDLRQFPHVFDAYEKELEAYPTPQVISSLRRCMRELKTFPALADIISRIDDTRPGAEEAWAMLPAGEENSVVWTEEMAQAHAIARPVMDDPIAARMAFREAYTRLVSEARSARRPARWNVSFGHDPSDRERAIRDAVSRRRLSVNEARAALPGFDVDTPILRLEGRQADPDQTLAHIGEIIGGILEQAPQRIKDRSAATRALRSLDPDRSQEHEARVRAQIEEAKKRGGA